MKKQNKQQKTGAQALVDSLAKAGTEVLFGYPGGQALDIFNCLPEAPFQFILGRHEQGCVHMADGYARAKGKPGVCLVTSGRSCASRDRSRWTRSARTPSRRRT